MNLKHAFGYGLTAIVALGVGGAIGGSASAGTTTATPARTATVTTPAETVTSTATSTKTVPGPTVTKTVRKPAKTHTKTVKVTVTPKAKASFPGDGTYEVGVDIKAGTYVSAPPSSGNCYWARLSGGDGLDDIIANNNSAGQSLVTIASTDKFFQSSGCSEWRLR